jgi:hypothetical protein
MASPMIGKYFISFHLTYKDSTLPDWRTRKKIFLEITKKHIYNAFIQSHINYLVGIWGNAYEKELNSFNVMQIKVIKIMYNFNLRKSTNKLYK